MTRGHHGHPGRHLGADVNKDNMETRIINADLVAVIGKRDVRALPGPVVPAARAATAPASTFPTPTDVRGDLRVRPPEGAAEATAAADLGERAMTWQDRSRRQPAGHHHRRVRRARRPRFRWLPGRSGRPGRPSRHRYA